MDVHYKGQGSPLTKPHLLHAANRDLTLESDSIFCQTVLLNDCAPIRKNTLVKVPGQAGVEAGQGTLLHRASETFVG